MNKKYLIVVVGVLLLFPASVAADYIVTEIPTSKPLYKISNKTGSVDVFDDQDNKCYVVTGVTGVGGGRNVAISCVKR